MMEKIMMLPSFWIENTPYDWGDLKEGQSHKYKKGQPLFLEGEKMKNVFLIKQGKIKLSISNQEGNEKTVGYLGENSIVGTSSLFNNAEYMFNATAVTNSHLLKFDRDEFIHKVMSNEQLTLQIFKIMSLRIRILTNHALDLSFNHSFKRLASALLEISETYGKVRNDGKIFIDFTITQREISELIGTTLVTVSNHLRKLMELEIIEKQNQQYIILDMDKLQKIANGNE